MRTVVCCVVLTLNLCSPVLADQITGWTTSNSWSGQQGHDNLVAQGTIHPTLSDVRDPATVGIASWPGVGNWSAGSALYDANFGKIFVSAKLTDTGGWTNSVGQFKYCSLMVGESADGIDFPTWREILWTNPEQSLFRMFNFAVYPDPARPKVWQGFFGWNRVDSSFNILETGTSRIEIDWTTSTVRVGNPSGVWSAYSIGSYISNVPAKVINGRVSSIRHKGNNVVEMWKTARVARSGWAPCDPPTSTYVSNTDTHMYGSQPEFQEYDINTESVTQSWQLVDPGTMGYKVWTDYRGTSQDKATSIATVSAYDWGSRLALYYGTADQRICDWGNTWNPWAGLGIRFLRVTDNGSTLEGIASIMFTNLNVPNWTCAAGVTECYASDIRKYALVSIFPVEVPGSSLLYFYTTSWGSSIPG